METLTTSQLNSLILEKCMKAKMHKMPGGKMMKDSEMKKKMAKKTGKKK